MRAKLLFLVFTVDVSWQTSLAGSAVSAAEDVRSAVRAARTAENAKAAASSAAYTAQSACDSGTAFPTIDEARAAQTRASIAQSHAFHAAVVEHEAKAVKRRATLALAHDVKCWNVHRKREMLQACIAHARSQHEATRRAVDAWSCLRDGFIGSPIMPTTQTRKAAPATSHRGKSSAAAKDTHRSSKNSSKLKNSTSSSNPSPVAAAVTIAPAPADGFGADAFCDLLDMPMPGLATAIASNTNTTATATTFSGSPRDNSTGTTGSGFSCIDNPSEGTRTGRAQLNESENEATATIYPGSPAIVAVDHNDLLASHHQPDPFSLSGTAAAAATTTPTDQVNSSNNQSRDHRKSSSLSESLMLEKNDAAAGIEILAVAAEPPIVEATALTSPDSIGTHHQSHNTDDRHASNSNHNNNEDNEIMSASMQSLVEGLMSWGGRFEADDVFALPTGMAASIALEESSDRY